MSTDDSSAASETKRFGEYHAERAQREAEWRQNEIIRLSVKHINRSIAQSDYADAARIARDRLLPALGLDSWSLEDFHEVLEPSPLAWDWEAINRYLDRPAHWEALVESANRDVTRGRRERVRGRVPADVEARRVIHRALKSIESIAVAQGAISGELTQSSSVLGYSVQLGQQWHGWEFDNPEELRIVDRDLHPPFTMCIGDPGNGKSTAAETLAEDAYQSGMKIIDLVDFAELENAVYDIESGDEDLRRIRQGYDLPTSFEETGEYTRPRIEILHPLCDGLTEAYLPYDIDDERWVAKPFVVPVADLDRTVFKTILGDLTNTQETALDQALAKVDGDWSLRALAEEVYWTEANEGVKRRLVTKLDTLASRGFLATREHEHAIDWERIFRDTRTITVFSCSLMAEKEHKLMAIAYLSDAIFDERMPDLTHGPSDATDYPTTMLVGREFQKIAPSGRKFGGNTNTEQRLEQYIVSRMQTIGEERRHVDMGLICDTQQWLQVNKGVRENVDRVVMFKLKSGIAETVFKELTGRTSERYAQTVSGFDRGEACVIGAQWLSSGRDFEMPITWIPPLCHHLDAENEDEPDGWRARARYRESEELRPSPFDVDGGSVIVADDGDEEPDPADLTPDGFEDFVDDCLQYTGDDDNRCAKAAVREAYAAYAADHGLETYSPRAFGQYLREFYPSDDVPTGNWANGQAQKCYLGLTFTETGERYREAGQ